VEVVAPTVMAALTRAVYSPRYGWSALHNGRDVRYAGGFAEPVESGDNVAIFPPGR